MGKVLIIALALGGLFAFGALPAMSEAGGSLFVTKGFLCGILDGNGDFHTTEGSISIERKNGTVKMMCKAKGLPNSAGKAVNWNHDNYISPATGEPGECGRVGGGPQGLMWTTDWSNKVSASGNASLTCTFHPDE